MDKNWTGVAWQDCYSKYKPIAKMCTQSYIFGRTNGKQGIPHMQWSGQRPLEWSELLHAVGRGLWDKLSVGVSRWSATAA